MSLAEKIILQRKRNGWSQEELADRLEVSRQSVSKLESGLSNPELDKILAMSLLFDVSTDYLLKNDACATRTEGDTLHDPSEKEVTPDAERADTVRDVSAEEVERVIALSTFLSWHVAIGVLLCIVSPVVLIFCAGLSEAGILSETVSVCVGLLSLFTHVAVAVALFIPSGIRSEKLEYLDTEQIRLQDDVSIALKARAAEYEKRYLVLLTVGVVLCIFSVIPLVTVSCMMPGDAVLAMVSCVCILLMIVAVGVFLIVHTSYVHSGFQKLLQEGEYSVQRKRNHVKSKAESIYWCIVTATYLAVSFLTSAWHMTWIIWVVAAVCTPILELIFGSRKNDKKC